MASENNVNIFVYDGNENPMDLNNPNGSGIPWKIDFGGCVVSKGKDHASSPTWGIGEDDNQIEITFDADRHRTALVSELFIADGYGLDPKDVTTALTLQPPAISVNQGGIQSATMSVHGEYATPKKMNFYFPLTITTDTGLVIKLLLGQTGTGPGSILAIGKDIAQIAMSAYSFGLSIADQNTLGTAASVWSLESAIKNLIGSNPWYVTAIGTGSFPSIQVPEVKIGKDTHPGILFLGPTSDGRKQAGCFYCDGGNGDYTFKLKMFTPYKAD